jgi:GNAT superfamily N-acetyltransferase
MSTRHRHRLTGRSHSGQIPDDWIMGELDPGRHVAVRPASEADVAAIAAVTIATAQQEEWAGANPRYVRHLLAHGQVVVAELDGEVAGFGAAQRIGSGPDAVTMLCDLFVRPAAHGRGCGRAMLAELWAGTGRRMTFSSLHANAVPLYTSFGTDAWWPLLYLHGSASRLAAPGWLVERSTPSAVARRDLLSSRCSRTLAHPASGYGRPCRHRIRRCDRCSRPAGSSMSSICSWPPTPSCWIRTGRYPPPARRDHGWLATSW